MSGPQTIPTDTSPPQGYSDEELVRWQRKLLPLMVRMLIGLAGFFFAASLVQLGYLHWRMEQSSTLDLTHVRQVLATTPGMAEIDRRETAALLLRGSIEADAMQRRHHQARVLLMARTWTVYLGFVTGMSLALLGSAFALGRVPGTPTTIKVDAGTLKAELLATAPGMILAFLGVALMISTILVNHKITVEDKNIYLWPEGLPSTGSSSLSKPAFPSLAPSAASSSPQR